MNPEDFLPNYPVVTDPSLQQKILNKKEFFDLKLKQKLEPIDKGEFLNHQKIIQRFMSAHTLYDELLLYHQTGTGKTGAAFAVTEELYSSKREVRCWFH
jgi:DNA polymerase III delta prime subunit